LLHFELKAQARLWIARIINVVDRLNETNAGASCFWHFGRACEYRWFARSDLPGDFASDQVANANTTRPEHVERGRIK
jgi:hypothetical protein